MELLQAHVTTFLNQHCFGASLKRSLLLSNVIYTVNRAILMVKF